MADDQKKTAPSLERKGTSATETKKPQADDPKVSAAANQQHVSRRMQTNEDRSETGPKVSGAVSSNDANAVTSRAVRPAGDNPDVDESDPTVMRTTPTIYNETDDDKDTSEYSRTPAGGSAPSAQAVKGKNQYVVQRAGIHVPLNDDEDDNRTRKAKVGEVVALTSKQAKHFNKHGCLAPYIPDDEDDEDA